MHAHTFGCQRKKTDSKPLQGSLPRLHINARIHGASTEQSTCTTTNSTSASATNVNSDTRATSATSATNATSATSATSAVIALVLVLAHLATVELNERSLPGRLDDSGYFFGLKNQLAIPAVSGLTEQAPKRGVARNR